MRRHPPIFWLNILLKATLVGLLVFGAFSGLQQFEGKAFGGRLGVYPIAIAVIPAAWAIFWRQHHYPYLADLLIGAPFLVDVAGNALDLYDTVDWWDDLNHLVNWALLSGGVGALLLPTRLPSLALAGQVIGFGAAAAIVWELAEYLAFIRNSPEFATAYQDTLFDMALGLAGATIAAAVATQRPLRAAIGTRLLRRARAARGA